VACPANVDPHACFNIVVAFVNALSRTGAYELAPLVLVFKTVSVNKLTSFAEQEEHVGREVEGSGTPTGSW